MTTDDIERAARLAYETYQHHRRKSGVGVTGWTDVPGKEQHRWCLAAAAVLNHPDTPASKVRLHYLNGDASWAWEFVTPKFQACWSAVTRALRRQVDLVAQQDRMAA